MCGNRNTTGSAVLWPCLVRLFLFMTTSQLTNGVSLLQTNESVVLVGLIVMVMHFLHAGSKCATRPGTEESMTTTIEFITALFYEVDEQLCTIPKHPEAHLWPSEVV